MTLSDAHEGSFALGSLRTTASHTIGVPHLVELLRVVPADSIVTSGDLTKAVTAVYGADLSVETLGTTGRNTGACWTQTGHLVGRTKKVR